MIEHFTLIPEEFSFLTVEDVCSVSVNEDYFCLLNSNSSKNYFLHHHFDYIAAFGATDVYNVSCIDELIKLKKNEFLFGHLRYDYKDDIFNLNSKKKPKIDFDKIHFFTPELMIICKDGKLYYYLHPSAKRNLENVFTKISKTEKHIQISSLQSNIECNMNYHDYLHSFSKIKEHIKRGDIYETNFCIEYSGRKKINPLETYFQLNEISKAPYSALYKSKINWLICSSPELYIEHEKGKIISKPIKGTIKRGNTEVEDNLLKANLKNNPKELTENIMIVDLVRNDLSTIAERDSVEVTKFLEIESYKQVHQMVSEVVCKLNTKIHPLKVLDNTFPMASMTGVPKKRALEITEETENFNRGIYSGTLGMITPENDFYFNVVIRSIAYNEKTEEFSFGVGSAITWKSEASKEYEECMLKAFAMKKVFGFES